MKALKILLIVLILLSLVALGFHIREHLAKHQEQQPVPAHTAKNGKYPHVGLIINGAELNADLAITITQRRNGLSVKEQLQPDEAMLFVFGSPNKQAFWMKGMKFPLDIFWLDTQGKVVHIEENLLPCSEDATCKPYSPDIYAMYVLETSAGFAESHGIKLGTQVQFKEPDIAW